VFEERSPFGQGVHVGRADLGISGNAL